jgi:anti-sigma factor NepR-like protein
VPRRGGEWGLMMDERKPVGQQKPMEIAATRKKSSAKPAKLGREVQARLGQQLRAMYDEVLSQGVPDRFTDLLNRLDDNGSKDRQ